jgi:hypothetical protein
MAKLPPLPMLLAGGLAAALAAAVPVHPKLAMRCVLDLPGTGGRIPIAASFIQNVRVMDPSGWSNGRCATNLGKPHGDVLGSTTFGARCRHDSVPDGARHAIEPSCDEAVCRRELQDRMAILPAVQGPDPPSAGSVPAEACISGRLIPGLVAGGAQCATARDVHVARAGGRAGTRGLVLLP